MAKSMAMTLDPVSYMKGLSFDCYDWQSRVLRPDKRMILKCPRQSGKSTVVGAKASHKCKHKQMPGHAVRTHREQAIELMEKIGLFLPRKRDHPGQRLHSREEIPERI